MKFIVSRTTVSLTENRKPCEEAAEEELTPLDYRTVRSMEEAKKKVWYKDWLEGGVNHRVEDGMVVCDKKTKERQWVVDIATLEELLLFQNKYSEIEIAGSAPFKETSREIKILGPQRK
ncbi:MAG: hypothetical protein M0033_02095 [Nitrospiraceae bacterium]|nr:hypothetical protein [Nitrospiraceae bacterium]MDA8324989.1 hypothetical protein [Nitrospiraceae bacterium]